MALSTLFQVLLRALVSIIVQFQWRPALDDAIAMYFPADPASLHSFPPCLLCQQRGVLFIVPVKKYRLLFIRFITGIFGRGIGTLTVRVYWCGPLLVCNAFKIARPSGLLHLFSADVAIIVNPFRVESSFRSIVCYFHTFGNNLGIKRKFAKYFKESCCLSSDQHFSFKCFKKNAFVRKIFPKSSGLFWPL